MQQSLVAAVWLAPSIRHFVAQGWSGRGAAGLCQG